MATYDAHRFASIRATASFAALRGAEVAVGMFACLLVSTVFHVGSKWSAKRSPPPESGFARSTAEPEALVASLPVARLASPLQVRMLLDLQGGLVIIIRHSHRYRRADGRHAR
jgi:hypothetical protein